MDNKQQKKLLIWIKRDFVYLLCIALLIAASLYTASNATSQCQKEIAKYIESKPANQKLPYYNISIQENPNNTPIMPP
jgi:hypothetical protein